MKIDKWVYTTDELINFITNHIFDDYAIFIKSQLVERHDKTFVCGTWTSSNKDYRDITRIICIYGNHRYLLTELDVIDKHITFNLIKEGDNHDPN